MPGAGTVPRFAWPVTLDDGANDLIVFQEHTGAVWGPLLSADLLIPPQATPLEAFHRGDGAAADLEAMLRIGLDGASAGGGGLGWTYAVAMNSNGTIEISSDAGGPARQFRIRWDLSLADAGVFGWLQADTPTSVTVSGTKWAITSARQASHVWLPEQTYTDDTEDLPIHRAAQSVAMSGRRRTQRWSSGRARREVFLDFLPPNKVFAAEESLANEAFEWFYLWLATGGRFQLTRDWLTVQTPDGEYVINDVDWLNTWPVEVPSGMIRLYDITIPMDRHVA